MRLSIDHRTIYRFSEPQARLVQLLRMTPQNTHDQTVAAWRIDVDRDAKMRDGRDGYANLTTMLYVDGPVDSIEINVSGEVLTTHSNGLVFGTSEPFPPTVFLRDTEMTRADDAIGDFARSAANGAAPLGALHALNEALCDRFTLDAGRPKPGVTAADAFRGDRATARDLAQIFIIGARSLGAPARYVTGYRLIETEAGGERAGGGDHRPAPHGWAEAFIDRVGWIGFDPCIGRSPEDGYVRVACALDAAGSSPVAGSRSGRGLEELDVDVAVSRED